MNMTSETRKAATNEENKQFWKQVFEENDIANRLLTLSQEYGDSGIVIAHPYFGNSVVKAKPASVLGDNFFSDTFIVNAESKKDKLIFTAFVKVLPNNAVMKEAAYDAGMHQREIGMYSGLFALLQETFPAELSHTLRLDVPQLYYCHVEDTSVISATNKKQAGTCIVLENAVANGYLMGDKSLGADDEHTRLAFASLAHLHALTVVAFQRWIDPTTHECLLPKSVQFLLGKTLVDHSPAETVAPWVEAFIELANELSRPDIAEWLTALSKRLHEIMEFDTYKTCGPVPCIAHGDFWINNILFKYDGDGRPIASKILDFQMSRIGHPASDVLYFLFTSTTSKMRKSHSKDWLLYYYDTFMGDLANLGSEVAQGVYTWEEFLKDFKKRSLRWMVYSGMVMGMVLNKKLADELDVMHQTRGEGQQLIAGEEPKANQDVATRLTDHFASIIRNNKISNNPVLSSRLIELFEEVKDMDEGKEKWL